MKIYCSTKTKIVNIKAILPLGLALAVIGSGTITPLTIAQASNQEPFLPPEVVPIDPAVAARLPQPQMSSGNTQVNYSFQSQSVPGLVASQPGYNANYLPKTAPGFQQNNLGTSYVTAPQPMAQFPTTQSFSQQSVSQPAMSQWMQPGQQPTLPSQSQTLAGSVQNQSMYNPGRSSLSGISHAVSLITMYGLGTTASLISARRSPYTYYNTGLLGAGLVNYGLRNAFRF